MALVKLGGLISDIRGSVGGSVFSRNKSGAIVRQRTTPINPKTARQSAARSVMATVSALWRTGTTAAQKAAWEIYAANVPAKNKLGEVIRNSGFNHFVKSNGVILNAGLTAISHAPAVFTLPGEDATFAIVASTAAQTLACTFDDTADWCDLDGAALIVQQGIPVSESISYFDGPWRSAGIIEGDSQAPPSTGETVPAGFIFSSGQQIFARAKILLDDGRVSDWFRCSIIGVA